jgi:hypothetical protein
MRKVLLRGVAGSVTLLFLLSFCSGSLCAEGAILVKLTGLSLDGIATVTKADGTTETVKELSKPISLPATIEMTSGKGSFWISLPTEFRAQYNTVSWTMNRGETVRVSLLKAGTGVRVEYVKGARKMVLLLKNSENVVLVSSMTGETSVVISQNRVTVHEKSAALLTCPMGISASPIDQARGWGGEKVVDIPGSAPDILYSAHRLGTDRYGRTTLAGGWPLSVTLNPGGVAEVEFRFSPEDRYIDVVRIVTQEGSVEVTRAGRTVSAKAGAPPIEQPITVVPAPERLAVPFPEPETIEQSPYVPD